MLQDVLFVHAYIICILRILCSLLLVVLVGAITIVGTLPFRIHELHQLRELDLALNTLTGLVPYLAHIHNLEIFTTTGNYFEGHHSLVFQRDTVKYYLILFLCLYI